MIRRGVRSGSALLVAFSVAALAFGCGGGDDGDSTDTGGGTGGEGSTLRFYDWEAKLVGAPGVDDPAQPLGSRRAAEALAQDNPGTIVVESSQSPPKGFFVLRDEPAMTSADIVSPEQSVDPVTDEPVITFEFTEDGKQKFEDLTRQIVERAEANAPASAKASPEAAQPYSGHLAMVLEGEVVSLPLINFVENPDGIAGSNGATIEGAFTVSEAQELVATLAAEAGG